MQSFETVWPTSSNGAAMHEFRCANTEHSVRIDELAQGKGPKLSILLLRLSL